MEEIYAEMKRVFEEKVTTTPHGLEVITGSKNGYGKIAWTYNGIQMHIMAYRAAWILENGPITDGHHIDHDPACPKSCVTVAHLQALSRADHTSLSWQRGEIQPWQNTNPRQEAWCLACGVQFQASKDQLYCSRDCQTEAKEERRKRVRYPRPDTKICEQCGEEFTPKRVDTTLCSRECIEIDQNSKRKERGKFVKICINPDCLREFTHNLERVQCCSKSCATSVRHRERRAA